jgi:hypothetical protein
VAVSLNPATRAAIARGKAMGALYKRQPNIFQKAAKLTRPIYPSGGVQYAQGPRPGQVPGLGGGSSTAQGPRPEVGGGQGQGIPPISPYVPMIGGDWEVQGIQGAGEARLERARGGFRQSIRQALIDMGVVDPSKLGNLGQWIDQDTIQKAAQNKYSRTAQIAQREELQRRTGEASLAARGILSSGQTTTEAERRLAEAEGGRYEALRSFLGAGEQGLTGLADLESEIAEQLAQARFNAAQRAAEYYGLGLERQAAQQNAAAQGGGGVTTPSATGVARATATRAAPFSIVRPVGPARPTPAQARAATNAYIARARAMGRAYQRLGMGRR